MNYQEAMEALEKGELIARELWEDKGMFIFKQIPANVGIQFVPNMQSLPINVKDVFVQRGKNLNYFNQSCMVDKDNNITSYIPHPNDFKSEDFYVWYKKVEVMNDVPVEP